MTDRTLLKKLYRVLLDCFGPQHWWPAETPFEVMVGAILTQNTNWGNVERAIANLKEAGLLDPRRLHQCPMDELALLIRPAGYFNVKARRLKALLDWLVIRHDGSVRDALTGNFEECRAALLAINGVGPETADSILLYAGNRPTFVVDAYTRRILSRHGLCAPGADYEEIKSFFENNLPRDTQLFNEYHALLVRLGKHHCKPKPECGDCPAASVFAAAGRPATTN